MLLPLPRTRDKRRQNKRTELQNMKVNQHSPVEKHRPNQPQVYKNVFQEINRKTRETVLDLQVRSMGDNLVFVGISEEEEEDPEKTVKNFVMTHLKLPEETVKNIAFHQVHRIGGKRPGTHQPRPIMVKFVNYKQKEQVKSHGPELRGKDFSVSDQSPRESLDRRRVLFPLRRKLRAEGSRTIICVDKIFVNGQLYQDESVTLWLYH